MRSMLIRFLTIILRGLAVVIDLGTYFTGIFWMLISNLGMSFLSANGASYDSNAGVFASLLAVGMLAFWSNAQYLINGGFRCTSFLFWILCWLAVLFLVNE
jgi:hypothetical protein